MNTISIFQKPTLGLREAFVEGIKVNFVIKPLQNLFRASDDSERNKLQQMPIGTVGRDLINLVDKHNFEFIPKFEDHDLKHLILDYGMTTIDEIRMQCYLIGNGNRTLVCLLFAMSGLLFPENWNMFYKDYQKGKSSPSILDLNLTDCKFANTQNIRTLYSQNEST